MLTKSLLSPASLRPFVRIFAILILLGGAGAQATLPVQAAPLYAPIGVTTTADEYGSGAGCSLREAIQAANTDTAFGGCPAGSGTDTISLPAGTYTLSILGNNEQDNVTGDLDILSNLTITGNPAAPATVVIQGGSGWDDKIIDINPLVDRVLTVTINGVTVQNGNNTSVTDFYGGGIQAFGRVLWPTPDYSTTGTLNLQNCIVANNTYAGPTSIDEGAGGLLAEQINLNVDNCTFRDNSAGSNGYGGGISIVGINEAVSITNSRFEGNSSIIHPGGAIYIRRTGGGSFPAISGTITLDENIFTVDSLGNNNRSTYGGAIYLVVQSGGLPVSLDVNVNHSIFNGNSATSSGSGIYYSDLGSAATFDAENNWWGCNGGPGAADCNTVIYTGTVIDYDPWLVFSNVANPAAVNIGGATTLTAGFQLNSAGGTVAGASLTAFKDLPVSWGSVVHGTLSGQQTAIQSTTGTATATLTNDNTCNNSSANATAEGVTATGTATVQCPDLTITKSNNVSNSTTLPTGWNWTLHVANGGAGYASFNIGATLLADTLPASGLTYGTPTVSGATGLTGTVNCAIDGSSNLACTASTAVQLNAAGSFDVVIPVTPSTTGPFVNPRPAGGCSVDPVDVVIETNNGNNACAGNTVTVNQAPSITSANTTTFTATVPGTFTVTTIGYPTGASMVITTSGALPSGVTFTDNHDGTATLAGTPASGTQGNYPITITAANGILPNATQSFTLVVQPDLSITSANNTTFTIASPNSFTVTTAGVPIPSITPGGATLPSGVTFVDNLDGTGTLSGTPAGGTENTYNITFTAHNGVATDYVQNFTLTVSRAATTTTLADAPDPSVVGQAVTFNYTVSPVAPASGTPTGSVTVSNGSQSCTGTVAAGSCTITFTAPGTSSFTATYAGDTSYTGSVSASTPHTVNQASTTTTITSDTPDPSVVGQAVTFSYGVTVNSPGAGTPTGSVTVSNGSQSCTGTVVAGSCTITFTAPGTTSFTATYAGDTNFAGSTSASTPHTVNQAGTSASISDTPDPSVVGQAVTFSYTVNVTAPGAGTPTGSVTVSNGTQSCTGTVAAGSCTITFTAPGTSSFTATYAGDTNFAGSASASTPHTVNQAGTTTTISDTPDPSVVGQAVTFSYTVNVTAPGAGTPTGSVTVSNGTQNCTGTVAAGSCTITFTAPGTSSFTATYAGDTNFAGSTSASTPHTVNQAGTTTTISDTPDPSVVGQTVTFNYAVSPVAPATGTPTGSVTVSNGTQSCTDTVAAGSCTITFTAPGTTSFTATYAGDTNFAGSTSASTPHTVNQASTTTTITSDTPDPSVVGQTVTFSYGVTVNSPGTGTPTGNVTVSNGSQNCTGTVAAGSCTITFTAPGTSSFTATYAGDTNFAGSTSASTPHTVNQAGTSATITSDLPDPSTYGQAVTFNYTVAVVAPGAGTPTGNVTVSNGTDSCTSTVAAGSCTIAVIGEGTTSFTATYAGDTNFAGSTSAAESHTVNQAGTTTTISDTPDPSVVGQAVTFSYSMTVTAPGTGTPTGNVTVSNGTDSCTGTVAAGSCTITFTAPGTTTFTATYAGDTNFAGSTSAGIAHTVDMASTTIAVTTDLPDPSVAGIPLPVVYTVTVVAPGSGTPTGNVTITDGVDSCTVPVATGTCNLTPTTIGGRFLTATYSGDSNFGGSTSVPEPHIVQGPPAVASVNSVADTGDGQLLENEHTAVAMTQLLVTFNKDMNALDAATVGNYHLVLDGSPVDLVNGATYNNLTFTTTLNINGGVALPQGNYTLTVSGILRDTLGAPIGTDFVRHFVIDTANPFVPASGIIGYLGSDILVDGSTYSNHFTSFTISFNEDVSNSGGGAGVDDVTNPLNYLLLQTGPDGIYDTDTCLEFATNGNLPLDDDIRIPTGPVTYDNGVGSGPFVSTLTLNGGIPLTSGVYRLLVCGTTSIVDLAGNPLNGGVDSVLDFSIIDPVALPNTGFAPDRVTVLPEQTVSYAQSDLWLEIPKLGVKMDIVGVPQSKDGTWDVSWLGSNAGWLNGTAYPTWNGNSVLTGHVVDANGKAGPFRYVNTLWYGDQVIIHAGGAAYIYEVRSVTQVNPGNTSQMLKHEELPWVTLVTCRGYDPATGEYKYRVLVRAVLVDVK